MTLEEINEVGDKAIRLQLLTEYIDRILQAQRDEDELSFDEEMYASRDEAHGMMSRFGKPSDD